MLYRALYSQCEYYERNTHSQVPMPHQLVIWTVAIVSLAPSHEAQHHRDARRNNMNFFSQSNYSNRQLMLGSIVRMDLAYPSLTSYEL